MWAHSILESIQSIKNIIKKTNFKETYIDYVLNNIKASICFNIGDFSTFDRKTFPLIQSTKDSELLVRAKEPYQTLLIEYFSSYARERMLSNTRTALLVNCFDNSKRFDWLLYKGDVFDWIPIHYHVLWSTEKGFQLFCNYNDDVAEKVGKAFYDDPMGGFHQDIEMFCQFCELLNCKNIGFESHSPPKNLNKKRIKAGKMPLFSYKTLVIKPVGKKQEAQAAQGLWDNRVHLCRGHFKTYTEKNPLFGRITGRFWWQPAVRGNKEKGVVMKDYLVEA